MYSTKIPAQSKSAKCFMFTLTLTVRNVGYLIQHNSNATYVMLIFPKSFNSWGKPLLANCHLFTS